MLKRNKLIIRMAVVLKLGSNLALGSFRHCVISNLQYIPADNSHSCVQNQVLNVRIIWKLGKWIIGNIDILHYLVPGEIEDNIGKFMVTVGNKFNVFDNENWPTLIELVQICAHPYHPAILACNSHLSCTNISNRRFLSS